MNLFLICIGLVFRSDSVDSVTPVELVGLHRDINLQENLSIGTVGLYYIYPWNESYYWRFPLDNSTCKDNGLQHYMMENSGTHISQLFLIPRVGFLEFNMESFFYVPFVN
jgi:hypothetical protein